MHSFVPASDRAPEQTVQVRLHAQEFHTSLTTQHLCLEHNLVGCIVVQVLLATCHQRGQTTFEPHTFLLTHGERPRDQNVLVHEQLNRQYSLCNYKRKKGKSLPFALFELTNYTIELATVGVPHELVNVAELGGTNLHSTAGAEPKAVYGLAVSEPPVMLVVAPASAVAV